MHARAFRECELPCVAGCRVYFADDVDEARAPSLVCDRTGAISLSRPPRDPTLSASRLIQESAQDMHGDRGAPI